MGSACLESERELGVGFGRATLACRAKLVLFLACRSGATAVEFGFVGMMLIMTILFIMVAGLIVYYNQALDYATSKAARQIMIGAAQTNAVSQSTFRTQYVCGNLPAVFNCANVIVNVQTATEASQPGGYYSFVNSNQTALTIPTLSNAAASYALGTQGSYEYLQVIYPIPFIPAVFSSIFGKATYNGAPTYLAISTAAFLNEQY